MNLQHDSFLFSSEKDQISAKAVYEMLSATYWASERTFETVAKSMEHSLCYGILKDKELIGFARVITDHATIFWICDVIIKEEFRNKGLGRKFISFILDDPELKHLNAFLATKDAHKFYEPYGFFRSDYFMFRPALLD